MNVMHRIFIYLFSFLILPLSVRGEPVKTAVVKSRFDNIGKLLSLWQIPYREIGPEALNEQEKYGEYDAIFLPCGMEAPLHEKMSVIAVGRSISSVSLNGEAPDIEEEAVGVFIRAFVENGGSVYFSGFAFKYVQAAFEYPLSFFAGLPYIGESNSADVRLKGDMRHFCRRAEAKLSMGHEGWVAVKDTALGEVLAEGCFETPLGRQRGPMAILFSLGEGEAIYTNYHNYLGTDFTRFIVYRLTCSSLIKQGVSAARRWEQTVTAQTADAVHRWENIRSCEIPLKAGPNTLYIVSEAGGFQADVLDENGSLMYSGETHGGKHAIDLDVQRDSLCELRIFPSRQNRFKAFASVTASGRRIIPYYIRLAFISAASGLLVFIAYMLISKSLEGRKQGARHTRKSSK